MILAACRVLAIFALNASAFAGTMWTVNRLDPDKPNAGLEIVGISGNSGPDELVLRGDKEGHFTVFFWTAGLAGCAVLSNGAYDVSTVIDDASSRVEWRDKEPANGRQRLAHQPIYADKPEELFRKIVSSRSSIRFKIASPGKKSSVVEFSVAGLSQELARVKAELDAVLKARPTRIR